MPTQHSDKREKKSDSGTKPSAWARGAKGPRAPVRQEDLSGSRRSSATASTVHAAKPSSATVRNASSAVAARHQPSISVTHGDASVQSFPRNISSPSQPEPDLDSFSCAWGYMADHFAEHAYTCKEDPPDEDQLPPKEAWSRSEFRHLMEVMSAAKAAEKDGTLATSPWAKGVKLPLRSSAYKRAKTLSSADRGKNRSRYHEENDVRRWQDTNVVPLLWPLIQSKVAKSARSSDPALDAYIKSLVPGIHDDEINTTFEKHFDSIEDPKVLFGRQPK